MCIVVVNLVVIRLINVPFDDFIIVVIRLSTVNLVKTRFLNIMARIEETSTAPNESNRIRFVLVQIELVSFKFDSYIFDSIRRLYT
jgi:hypothetical protein